MGDTCGDIESVGRIVQAEGWLRVGIDGVDDASRSQLAENLSQILECPQLEVADYLHQNQGGFVDFIDYPALSAAIASMPAFVLSGVCLREVLANLGARLDGNIYIKRMHGGIWVDEEVCVFPEGVDATIDAIATNRAMMSQSFDEPRAQVGAESDSSEPDFAQEVMRYHDAFSPQEQAELVFEQDSEVD